MDYIDDTLKKKLAELNQVLTEQNNAHKIQNKSLNVRSILSEHLGEFKQLERMSEEEIANWVKRRPVIAVDGSTNTYGATFPHQLFVFQAMAKSSIKVNGLQHIATSDLYTPLDENERMEIMEEVETHEYKTPDMIVMEKRAEILARLEVEAAIQAIKTFKPFMIMFDGGFLRYAGKCTLLWEEYKQLALENNVLSIGVIEEVGTYEIQRHLGSVLPESMQSVFDRDILFGLLNVGEVLFVNPEIKTKKSYYTCFGRMSQDPQAVAFDCFREQMDEIESMIKLSYALTPIDSRGINIWLDIVDEEIKISNKVMEFLLNAYISKDIQEKFLSGKRSKRTL